MKKINPSNWEGIIDHLEALRELLLEENPTPSFIFVIESKIRAYERKLKKIIKGKADDSSHSQR